ncbi:MAG: hypothetical protein NTW45_05030 [Rhodocyclales bacterium]|nr:hypothetical protein [Rhodocyclales bacterium]
MSYLKHAVAVVLLLPCLVGAGLADDRGHDRDRGRHVAPRPAWHGEIGRFHERDMDLWRGGRWHHGRHDGRVGWWWIVAGAWYFYPTRIDTYPDPYQPPVVVVPPAPAPTQYWYYCPNPAGYYPYVVRCAVNWQRVPATVPPNAPPR